MEHEIHIVNIGYACKLLIKEGITRKYIKRVGERQITLFIIMNLQIMFEWHENSWIAR